MTTEQRTTAKDVDRRFNEAMGVPAESRGLTERELTHGTSGVTTSRVGVTETTHGTLEAEHKEGILDKIEHGLEKMMGKKTYETTESERVLGKGKVETDVLEHDVRLRGKTEAHIVDEREVIGERSREKVIAERDILAPVEHRRVVEQQQPQEFIRIVEEKTIYERPVIVAKERRKVIDVKENRLPIKTRVLEEKQIRAPVEHRRIIEERSHKELRRVIEENVPLAGAAQVAGTHATLKGAEIKETPIVGKESLTGKEREFTRHEVIGKEKRSVVDERLEQLPTSRRVLEEYDVEGVVETLRVVEEIETVEYRRRIEERVPLDKVILDEEVIKKHRSKKWF